MRLLARVGGSMEVAERERRRLDVLQRRAVSARRPQPDERERLTLTLVDRRVRRGVLEAARTTRR